MQVQRPIRTQEVFKGRRRGGGDDSSRFRVRRPGAAGARRRTDDQEANESDSNARVHGGSLPSQALPGSPSRSPFCPLNIREGGGNARTANAKRAPQLTPPPPFVTDSA